MSQLMPGMICDISRTAASLSSSSSNLHKLPLVARSSYTPALVPAPRAGAAKGLGYVTPSTVAHWQVLVLAQHLREQLNLGGGVATIMQ